LSPTVILCSYIDIYYINFIISGVLMTVLPIRTIPDPILMRKAKRVRIVDDSIKKLISDMLETLHAVPGRVGLAAPQIGISQRVIIISLPSEENDEEKGGDIVIINPEIVKRFGKRPVDEGCLSIPGYRGEIKRAESVTAKGRDQNGKEIRIKTGGLLAQALEHEIDHLNGTLYLDHLEGTNNLRRIEPEEAPL